MKTSTTTYLLTALLLAGTLPVFAQSPEIPAEYVMIKEVVGDLDRDGIDEKVAVYNMSGTEDEINGTDRELIIYKKTGADWAVWKRSAQAVGNSKDGGMMGDPFGNIEIKNGALLVFQSGGSSWKWNYTDEYKFQNDEFELTAYTGAFGKICEYWVRCYFYISSNQIDIEKDYELCENGEQTILKKENESFVYKLGERIILQERTEKERTIVSPKYGHEINF